MTRLRIAVIGGGLGGLTAAHALLAAGHDVHVFESSSQAGGVLGTRLEPAGASASGAYRCELAASSFLGGPPHGALALCNELGVPVELAAKRARNRWIFIDGKLHALPRNPIDFARSDLLTWQGKLALFREPFARARHGGPETDESVHDFAARRFGVEVARAIVAPFVTGVFAADAHDVSLDAGFPRLAALDAAGGILRGGLKQLFTRKRGSAPHTARGMHAPVGGLGVLVDALTAKLGSRLHIGTNAHSLTPDASGVRLSFSSAVRSSDTDVRPSDTDVRPSDTRGADVRLPDDRHSGVRPSDTDVRRSDTDVRRSDTDVRPSDIDVRPSDTDVRPSDTDVRPSDTDVRPSDTDVRPSDTDVRRSDTDVRPSDTDVRPSDTDVRPNVRPSDTNVRPSDIGDTDVRPSDVDIRFPDGRHYDVRSSDVNVRFADSRDTAVRRSAADVRFSDGELWDRVVLAIPAVDAVPLVERSVPELAAKLAGFRRAPLALVYLGVPEADVPAAGDGFGFLVAKGEDLRVLGVVFESTVWPDRAPAGHALLRCIFGGGRDPDAAAMSDAALIEQACRDVGRAFGASAPLAPTFTRVVRWDHGLAQYAVGHRDRVREAVAVARRAKVLLAGADYRGPGVNDLCADAFALRDSVAKD